MKSKKPYINRCYIGQVIQQSETGEPTVLRDIVYLDGFGIVRDYTYMVKDIFLSSYEEKIQLEENENAILTEDLDFVSLFDELENATQIIVCELETYRNETIPITGEETEEGVPIYGSKKTCDYTFSGKILDRKRPISVKFDIQKSTNEYISSLNDNVVFSDIEIAKKGITDILTQLDDLEQGRASFLKEMARVKGGKGAPTSLSKNYIDKFINLIAPMLNVLQEIEKSPKMQKALIESGEEETAKLIETDNIRRVRANPNYLSIADILPKQVAFSPLNSLDEDNMLVFDREHNNQIYINENTYAEMAISPSDIVYVDAESELQRGPVMPLNRSQDFVFDVLNSFIIANCDIDFEDPRSFLNLHQHFPIGIPEKKFCQIVTGKDRPTKAQRNRITAKIIKLNHTPTSFEWMDVLNHYNNNRPEDEKLTQQEINKYLSIQDILPIIPGFVRVAQLTNGYKEVTYVIEKPPRFLESAIFMKQIKAIPLEYLQCEAISNDEELSIIKKHIAKIVVDAEYLIKNGKKLQNRHKFISFDSLLDKNGIVFDGKTDATRRKQRYRTIKKIKAYLAELLPKTKYLSSWSLYPNKSRVPIEGILLCYKSKSGKLLKSPKYELL